jgi:hypothetical protein
MGGFGELVSGLRHPKGRAQLRRGPDEAKGVEQRGEVKQAGCTLESPGLGRVRDSSEEGDGRIAVRSPKKISDAPKIDFHAGK